MSITDTAASGHPYATQSHAYTYDKIDRLLTGTDAANGNSYLRLVRNNALSNCTVTNPNAGVTTYNYDASSRLSTVQNANLQTVLTLTYDSADRIRTRTDSQGCVLTYETTSTAPASSPMPSCTPRQIEPWLAAS